MITAYDVVLLVIVIKDKRCLSLTFNATQQLTGTFIWAELNEQNLCNVRE